MSVDCIFCAIAQRTAAAEVIEADANTIAFLDTSPATRGHTLVIPRAHARNLYEVSDADLVRTMVMAKNIAARLRDGLGADGVNLINSCQAAAWQTVDHFHVHVIPRYKGDPLRLPWTPTPVESSELADVAEDLR